MIEALDLTRYSSDDLVYRIEDVDYASTREIEQARSLVENLNFLDQNAKLASHYGWEIEKIISTEKNYKYWLILHKVYGCSVAMAPSKILDEYWHAHILDTKKYMDDCNYVFGYYLHHYPYFGLTDKETKEDLANGFELTRRLFQYHFSCDLLGEANPCKSTDCR